MQGAKIMQRIAGFGLVVSLGLVGIGAGNAQAQDAFYQGKRIELNINFSAGGGTDLQGRLAARHIGRHIPGSPTVIVKNLPGAGGMKGANYVGAVAPKDGTAVGYFAGVGAAAWMKPLKDPGLTFDPATLETVATSTDDIVGIVRTDTPPGIKRPADIVKAKSVWAGGLRPNSSSDLRMTLALDLLGVNYRYLTGFPGNSGARKALMTNEVQFLAEGFPSFTAIIQKSLVKDGTVIPVMYWGDFRGDRIAPSDLVRSAAPGLKTVPELYEEIHGKPPSGIMWRTFLELHGIASTTQRWVVLPPGTPPKALSTLRAAFAGLNGDDVYKAEAQKTLKFVPVYTIGDESEKLLKPLLKMSPDVEKFMKEYVRKLTVVKRKNPKK
jgi:tripartite-type tricarboxylate transporter receptor subunit TctC